MSEPQQPAWQRRAPPPVWVRYVSKAIAFVVLLPLTKLFGRRWPRFMSRGLTRMLMRFPSYVPSVHDVFVCSYFKSGTNWTMQVAVQIAYRGRGEFAHIHDLVPWPDMAPRARYAVPLDDDGPRCSAPTGLRVIKTHLSTAHVPYSPEARYVCVVRDPKDVFVSGYHFTRAHVGMLMPSVADWLAATLSPDTPLGSWAEHLAGYWRLRDRPNVLFLTYESMRADLPGTVDRIAALMGVALSPDERAAVIERSSFAYMKTIGAKFEAPGAPWADPRGSMMRRGERGTAGELLSANDQRRVDDYWRAELARMQCDFPFDAVFGQQADQSAGSG